MTDNRDGKLNSSASIQPEKTPLMIGLGMLIRGEIIDESGDTNSRMLILGRVEGNISTKGVVQISKGAELHAGSIIEAGEIVVSGRVTGKDVTLRADVLVLQSTGHVEVDNVVLPPGGLEQMRGGVLIARLDMTGVASNEKATVVAAPITVAALASPASLTLASAPATVTKIHTSPAFSPRPSAFTGEVQLPEDFPSSSAESDEGAVDAASLALKAR